MDAQLKADLPDRVCGVRFYPRSLCPIREIIEDAPDSTRVEITRQVCDRLGRIALPKTQSSSRSPITWALPDPDRLPGRLIEATLQDLGYLGTMVFSAVARQLRDRDRDRDRWIGWNQAIRRERRHLIVNNSRFLILPDVKVPHLASRLLVMAARQLVPDFESHYGYAPVLMETFVENGRYQGTCYRAANWIRVDETMGRSRNDPRLPPQAQREPPTLLIRSIWIRPLGRSDRVRAELLVSPSVASPWRCA